MSRDQHLEPEYPGSDKLAQRRARWALGVMRDRGVVVDRERIAQLEGATDPLVPGVVYGWDEGVEAERRARRVERWVDIALVILVGCAITLWCVS